MTAVIHEPIPEMLGRRDTTHGQWVVDTCAPVRGNPYTDIVGRKMVVPVSPEETERCIRAHEMMHARVSPADDFVKWIERGIASELSLRCVEELRVNYLIEKAGFDPKTHLADGSETQAGEKVAQAGDWTSAVYTAVGFANSAGLKDFLTGVRRHNREWGDTLRDIVKQVQKEIVKSDRAGTLARTDKDPRTGLAPLGFAEVERLGEMVDRLANPPQPEESPEEEENQQGKAKEQDGQPNDGGAKQKGANGKPSPVSKEDVKKARPAQNSMGRQGVAPQWAQLRVHKLPLTRHAHGGMGRKRRATNIGRNPRRIGRMLVDPERRIFDATKKGNGGVVLIDGSGSMALTTNDIVKIVESAPGATVAVYSTDSANVKDNLLILAEKGRMVDTLPQRHGGNGVDGPALKWAIEQRQHSNAPVVFITDGQVHGISQGYNDLLAMDCINMVLKHKVIVRKNVEQGVKALNEIKSGRKPARWFPSCWNYTYQRLSGKHLK